MKAGEIYDFLRHPIQYIVHHSKDYKRLVSDKEVITSENKTLISKTNKLTSENQNLFEEVDSLEKIVNSQESQLISKSKQIIKLQEDNAYVQRDREDAIKNLLSIKLDVENALEVCHHVKTAEDVILARAKENKSDNRAFNEWIEIPKHQAEDGKRTAEERAVIYEGHAFGGRVNCFINQNPIARKEAITFYDFANKKFYYNNEALKAKDVVPVANRHERFHKALLFLTANAVHGRWQSHRWYRPGVPASSRRRHPLS